MTRLRGRRLTLCVKGASHAPRIDFWLAGLPADFRVDDARLAAFMERRAPGRDRLSTSRRESDRVCWTFPRGAGYILNENVRPGDYGAERTVPRPGHADYPQYVRYGRIPTGGGANSGRLTAAYCAAGGACLQLLARRGISVAAKIVRCGDIAKAKKAGDSVGGVIECVVNGVPAGLGGAMFDGLDGEIARAVFGIPGVKGVEFGNGFAACGLKGSENNDAFVVRNGEVRTRTNRHGGILGGFSSGMPIVFRVAMKPTPTIFREQDSVDLKTMTPAKLAMKGRHDPCIVRRAVPVVEAMAAFAVADNLLAMEADLPRICLTLTGKTLAEDLAQYRSQRLFTDMVELRVDLLERGETDAASDFPSRLAKAAGHPVPVIFTLRRPADGGVWKGSEKSREALFRRILKRLPTLSDDAIRLPVYADFESDFHALDALAERLGVKIVRSTHCFDGKVPKLEVAAGEILKLAVKGRDLAANVKLLNDFADDEREHVVMAMGYEGFFTRALARRSGSKWAYASVAGLGELGHVTPAELVRDFRFRDSDGAGFEPKLYGVTGWPLRKTRSPELHNAAFFAAGESALMVPLPCPDVRQALRAMAELDLRGMAVTIPHKESVIPLLADVDATAKAVGAVNTVRRDSDGTLHGFNTDVAGFTRAIMEFVDSALPREGARVTMSAREAAPREGARVTMEARAAAPREGARVTMEARAASPREGARVTLGARVTMDGLRVALLGNGGAAKACRHALEKLGCRVVVYGRHRPSGKSDPQFANCGLGVARDFAVIVNATPVDPIPEYVFRGDELVFDLRYVPEVTDLMARAAKAGCRVANGFAMLRYQAEEQRRIWSDRD